MDEQFVLKLNGELTHRELATILHALRTIQCEGRIEGCAADMCDHFDDCDSLDNEEIDALCERINLQPALPSPADIALPTKIRAMVILEGGIAQDVLSDQAIDWDRFDWDDFSDDPVTYWNDMGKKWQNFFARTAPEAYRQAVETVEDTRADEAKEEAERRLLNPFHDVPEPTV